MFYVQDLVQCDVFYNYLSNLEHLPLCLSLPTVNNFKLTFTVSLSYQKLYSLLYFMYNWFVVVNRPINFICKRNGEN